MTPTSAQLPDKPQYDPQMLLNSQPVMITVIDPHPHKVLFQNRVSHSKFGDISNLTCHENIAGCAKPCSFCRMPETAETGKPTASEGPLPNDEYLLGPVGKGRKRLRTGPCRRNHHRHHLQ
jgi:two-component system, cell cycle sensor histidine kinase and response regulator CckA